MTFTREIYTTPQRVQQHMRLQTAFSDSTPTYPSLGQVYSLIDQKMEEIENELRTSWRIKRSTERFSIQLPPIRLTGVPVKLGFSGIIDPLSATDGDALTIYDGTSDVDWLATKTEGRVTGDYWIEATTSTLWLKNQNYNLLDNVGQVTYRTNKGGRTLANGAISGTTPAAITVDSTAGFPYAGWIRIDDEEMRYNSITATAFNVVERGSFNTTAATHLDNSIVFWCPKDIEELCTKMVAVDLLTHEDWSTGGMISGELGSSQASIEVKIGILKSDIKKIIERYSWDKMAVR